MESTGRSWSRDPPASSVALGNVVEYPTATSWMPVTIDEPRAHRSGGEGAAACTHKGPQGSARGRFRRSRGVPQAERRSPRVLDCWRSAAVLCVLLVGLVHCDDDDGIPCRPGEPCPCGGQSSCELDCRSIDACTPICESADLCAVLCGSNCYYECDSISACEVETGPTSTVSCNSVTSCRARLGPESSASCSNLSVCDIECEGACEVRSSSVSSTSVWCASQQAAATKCSDTRWVCDSSC